MLFVQHQCTYAMQLAYACPLMHYISLVLYNYLISVCMCIIVMMLYSTQNKYIGSICNKFIMVTVVLILVMGEV